ncbi:MAG TPA: YcjX family protein [Marinobacterium sp.]|nr:YcjX family protein [Marinobacterium sp.]
MMKARFRHQAERLLNQTQDRLLTQVRRIKDDRICVGITGLSRSGKSSFIISLINQLKQYRSAQLSAFSPWLQHRIIGVQQHPLEDRYLPSFDYLTGVQALSAEPPEWPASTTDISGALIEVRLRVKSLLGRASSRSLYIEIRDYPGEWLLDLPLLEMSYREWCQQQKQLLSGCLRSDMASNPIALFTAVDPSLIADAGVLRRYTQLYKQFLQECRTGPRPLSMVQPGRYLLPGREQSLPEFFPLLSLKQDAAYPGCSSESYLPLLERRFEQYKREIVKPFFEQFIRPIDRQVVLVDAVQTLAQGEAYLREQVEALEHLSSSFNYGSRRLFGGRIEKVLYAATKMDQVVARDHDQVRHLLASMVHRSLERVTWHEADYRVEAVASIRAGRETKINNEECIAGFAGNGEALGYVHPQIPGQLPRADQWCEFESWQPIELQPPRGVRADQHEALPHIRMDRVLQELIGDLCR